MAWNYGYSPARWPSLLTVLLLMALTVYNWRRRNLPGAPPLSIGCTPAALLSAGSAMEHANGKVARKVTRVTFHGVWQLPAVTAIACFPVAYVWPGRWSPRCNVSPLSIPPLLVLGLILTNDLHHLLCTRFTLEGHPNPQRGPGNWIVLAYACGRFPQALSVADLVKVIRQRDLDSVRIERDTE